MSDVELPGILLNDNMNNVEVPDVVMKNKTVVLNNKNVVRKNNNCDVELPEVAQKLAFGVVSGVEVPGDVEVPSVGMRNNMSPTANKRKLTNEGNNENENL